MNERSIEETPSCSCDCDCACLLVGRSLDEFEPMCDDCAHGDHREEPA